LIFQQNNMLSHWAHRAFVLVSPFQPFEMGDTHVHFIKSQLDSAPRSESSKLPNLRINAAVGLPLKICLHVINMCTDRHCGMAVMAFELGTIDHPTEELCKRLWVCIHVKAWVYEYSVCLQIINMYILVSVWRKLPIVRLILLLNISEFEYCDFFTFHKIVIATFFRNIRHQLTSYVKPV